MRAGRMAAESASVAEGQAAVQPGQELEGSGRGARGGCRSTCSWPGSWQGGPGGRWESWRETGAAEAVPGTVKELQHYLECAERLADQVKRRVLEGERIPQEEKIYSVFEEHTRWCAKGKAGRAVELGVPVSVIESEHQFILHHAVMWEEEDVDMLPGLIEQAQALYPELRGCSFDKGFYSPSNRRRLDERLQLNAMPRKGRLSQADRERETAPEFVAARREHAAVESAINNLEQRGFDRVLAHGPEGFARMVALSVLQRTCIGSGCCCSGERGRG